MRKLIYFLLFLIFPFFAQSQSIVSGVVKGLKQGDTATIKIQKDAEIFFFKRVGGVVNNADVAYSFPNLSIGKWALSIDAKGYLFPVAKVLDLNNNNIDVTITLTPSIEANFNYTWQDDSSFVGHAQQSYINDKVEINVLGKAEKVPDDFNSINALNEYGFLFSDDSAKWTSEDTYRLYQTLKKLNFRKYGERDSVKVKAKWLLTERFIDRDIDFNTVNGIDVITISRAAFTYATPQVVTVDGVKGKFFSKRLYTALVYYYSDKGINKDRIAEIAKTRYGFEFLAPSAFLKTLMNETETNFQEFTSDEKIVILSMFEEFPDAMQRQGELKYMVRRVNGQPHPIYTTAPAIAWVGNNNIEWMESAFASQDITYMQRLVLHEKAHFLWEYIFDKSTQDDWATLGGWFKDPTSGSGWSTSNTTEFVSAYAHLKNPNEDMAESIAFYITNPEALRSRSLRKFEFIRDRIMKGTRYISVIRPDLTFQVYNLFPDYNYPGKIKRTKLEVIGGANEDKKVIFEVELTIMDKAFDGAQQAQCRFISSIGTIKDMWLNKVNENGSILRGEFTLSKFAKSGYWIIPQITIWDAVGNKRLENNSTYGVKCFLNNPLEDVTAPLYVKNSLKLDSIKDKFIDLSGYLATDRCGTCADTLKPTTALRLSYDFIEKNKINPDGRAYATIYFPTLDSTDRNNISPYSKGVQINGPGIKNDFTDSLKKAVFYFPVPEYFPSGYYTVSHIAMTDQALNVRNVLFDLDLTNTNDFLNPPINTVQRALRDSFYFKTKYPDYKPPILDINDIQIKATPTNPASPNGETQFEMWLWIKDTSDFPEKASGFRDGYFRLRDPQGLEHTYDIIGNGSTFANIFSDSSIYGYKRYYTKILLPVGSPPGLWGVTSITLADQAYNKKYYSFVEYVRFDVDQSNVLKVNPYVEILGKKVNSKNVDSVAVKIGCASCKDQKYRLRMYSSMGGSSVVFEGKMTKDTITITNLNLKGVNDGVLYATAFVLDSNSALIGTGRATYTKDVIAPKSSIIQSNISNLGKSNLDSLIIDMKVSEINCDYNIVFTQKSIVKTNATSSSQDLIKTMSTSIKASAIGDFSVVSGKLTDSVFKLKNINISGFQDGIIEVKVVILDSLGNETTPIVTNIYKDTKDPLITIKKSNITDLKALYTIESNEFLANSLTKDNMTINVGLIDSVKKVSNTLYNIYITRICNDTLNLSVKANALMDTVGNKNLLTSLSVVEKVIPDAPVALNLASCQGLSAVALTANALNAHTLVWYNSQASGTASLTTAPIPSTSTIGTVDFFVSQIKTSTGCESSKSKLSFSVNAVPSAPSLSRDTANYLVSSSRNGNIWYKDGAVLVDTSVRFKPIASGSYSIKITQNGCASAMSTPYYFIVTNLINLSSNEFIKLAPNPIKNQMNIDFVIKGYQRINVDFYELSTGLLKYSNKGVFAGSQLYLGQLSPGTYIVSIRSEDGKVAHKLKVIKL